MPLSLIQRVAVMEKKLRILEAQRAIDMISADTVKEYFGYSRKKLQLMRSSGKIKMFRCNEHGRDYFYSKKELEKLQTYS